MCNVHFWCFKKIASWVCLEVLHLQIHQFVSDFATMKTAVFVSLMISYHFLSDYKNRFSRFYWFCPCQLSWPGSSPYSAKLAMPLRIRIELITRIPILTTNPVIAHVAAEFPEKKSRWWRESGLVWSKREFCPTFLTMGNKEKQCFQSLLSLSTWMNWNPVNISCQRKSSGNWSESREGKRKTKTISLSC